MGRHAVFLLTMALMVGPAMAASGDRWAIAGDNVNLRRGPSTSDDIKLQLQRGQAVVERERLGDWRHVEVLGADGLLGWIHQSLLVEGPAEAPSAVIEAVLPKEPPLADNALHEQKPAKEQVEPPQAKKVIQAIAPPDPLSVKDLPNEEDVLGTMRDFVQRRDKLPKDPVRPKIRHSGREILHPVPIRKPGDQSRIPTELVLASSPEIAGIDLEAMEHFRDSVSYLNSRAWSVAGIKLFSEIEPVGGGVVQVKTTNDWFEVPKIGQSSYLNTLVDRWASAKADGTTVGVMLVDPGGDLLMHKTKP